MKEGNTYYYQLLNKEEQKVYSGIFRGLMDLQDSFQVPKIEPRRLAEIYFLVRMDHPEIFYSVTYKYRWYADSMNYEILPDYLFTKDKIRNHKDALEARVRNLTRGTEKLSEKDKELYVHNFICENVHYDKLKKEYSHEIIGSLGNGTAVCEGMAKAVKILLDRMGIWCIVVLSEANPAKGIKYRHAWNIVKVDGKYYHLDATFDNTLGRSGVARFDYVNLPDRKIFRDHEPSIYRIPACEDGDHFYYKEKKISWTTLDEVRNRTAQAVKKNKPLLFHWRGGYFTRAVFTEILKIFEEEGAKKNKQPHITTNPAQAVVCVRFEEEKTELLIENANENEEVSSGDFDAAE